MKHFLHLLSIGLVGFWFFPANAQIEFCECAEVRKEDEKYTGTCVEFNIFVYTYRNGDLKKRIVYRDSTLTQIKIKGRNRNFLGERFRIKFYDEEGNLEKKFINKPWSGQIKGVFRNDDGKWERKRGPRWNPHF